VLREKCIGVVDDARGDSDGNLEGSKFNDDPGLDDALQPLVVTQHPDPPTTLSRPPVSLDLFPYLHSVINIINLL
jgi:hypothetical protein